MRFIFKIFLLFGIIGGLYFFFFHSSFFALKYLKVEGKTSISSELIKKTISIPFGENIWRVNKELLASEVEKSWFVKVIDVVRRLPSTLVIKIDDQVPVAIVKSKNWTWLLSEKGLLWPVLRNVPLTGFSDLCRIKYLSGEISWVPGGRTKDENLLKALLLIRALAGVREIIIEKVGIMVFFLNFKAIFPRNGNLENKLRELKVVLDRLASKKGKWLIDLRFKNMAIVRERD